MRTFHTERILILSAFVGLLLSCGSSNRSGPEDRLLSQQRLTIRIKTLHEKADKYMAQEHPQQAEAVLDSILCLKQDAAAYLKLGNLYACRPGEHQKAERFYRKAMRLKKRYAEAYYALAMLYKDGPYTKQRAIDLLRWAIRYDPALKDAYYQKAMLLIRYPKHFTSALKELERLILIDPDYRSAYALYRRIGFAFHQANRLSATLPELMAAFPGRARFGLDRVEALHRAGRYPEAQEQLACYKERHPDVLPALALLYEAHNLFALGCDTLAHDAYWKGVTAISCDEESDAFFSDIIFLVTDAEYDKYMEGSLDDRKCFFRVFWRSRDPVLTTPFNERLPEHFARLQKARSQYRRYPDKEPLEFFLTDLPEPVERYFPTVLSQFSATRGSRIQQEVDDMGLIYVRHGKPDYQETFLSENVDVDMNLSWLYRARDGRPEMAFHFRRKRKPMAGGGWSDGYCLDIQPLYARDIITLGGLPSIELGTSTSTTNVVPEHRLFDVPFCHFCFKGQDGLEAVFYHYELTAGALPDPEREERYRLLHEIVVFDGRWEEVHRYDTTETAGSMRADATGRIIRTVHQRLAPGTYFSGMRLINEQTRQEGILKTTFHVPSTRGPDLRMSDIMLADVPPNAWLLELEPYGHSLAPYIVPNIQRRFRGDAPIVLYFEVYNLILGRNERSDFTIRLKMTQITREESFLKKFYSSIKNVFFNEKNVQISVQDAYSGNRTDEWIVRSVVLPDDTPGEYELEISVQDRKARTRITKTVGFKIIG